LKIVRYKTVLTINAVLTHGHAGQLHGDPTSIGAHVNLCMLFTALFSNV